MGRHFVYLNYKNGFVTITHDFFITKNVTLFTVAATDKSLKITMVSTEFTSVSLFTTCTNY